MFRRTAAVVFAGLLATSQVSCIRKTLILSQVKSSKEAAVAVGEIADYDVARVTLQNSLSTLEGMNHLAPNQELIHLQLARSWVTYGFAFAQDDMEAAEEGTHEYDVAKARTVFAYERAVKWGMLRLGEQAEGFDGAKKNDKDMAGWLAKNFDEKEDAEVLFWVGYAWLARVTVLRDKPEMVAELWIGVKMLERSLELDPDYNDGNALTALAAYHARASMAELDEAKKLFEQALAKTERKTLLTQVNYASRYACMKQDRVLYDKLIAEALNFDIASAPKFALANTIAKRKAFRASKKEALVACGFDATVKSTATKPSDLANGEVSLEDFMGPAKPADAPPLPPATATAAPVPPPASTTVSPVMTAPPLMQTATPRVLPIPPRPPLKK
jgi:tetratricopeptide (TPR) repeat protein